MDSQIASLVPLKTIVNRKAIKIKYEMIFSMVDGKVINAVTGATSTLYCHLCKATSKDFNRIDQVLSNEIEVPNLACGLSTLHAWINFYKWFLHLGYKIDTKKWQARGADAKAEVAA